MAEHHPIWRGHLRLALVSCPVALYSARHDAAKLHFHFINPDTGNRVRMVTVDAETSEELSRGDLARGFEFKKDHYVLLDNDDFERAKIDTSSVLTVNKFVPGDSIDPVYFDASYYVAPDGDAGEDVYVVLRDAIAKTGRYALSRLVIARRERAVALMPMGNGMILHTLYEERDLYNADDLFATVPAIKPDPEMVKLATQLIDRQTGRYDPADAEDRYETRLREIIEAKVRGVEPDEPAEDDEDRGKVIDLMAALKKSLSGSSKSAKGAKAKAAPRKAPSKPARKPARKRA